jgi:cytochrome c-type protein NapC
MEDEKKDLGQRRWLGKIRGGPIWSVVVGAALGMLLVGTFAKVMVYTSTEAFCAEACHEMANNVTLEYKDSLHDVNRTGVRATCADCHVPKHTIPLYFKKMGALHDLWSHLVTGSVDTPEKFEAKRYELAKRVWLYMKETDSRECRNCHNTAKMDSEKQSEKAQARHEKARKEKLTCIDCHFAITHNEPEGPGPQEIKIGDPGRVW